MGKCQRMLPARFSTRPATVAALAGAVFALAAPPIARAQIAGDPHVVKIVHCSVTKPRPFSHRATGTQISYVNTGPIVLHDVTFRVEYRTAAERVTRTFEDVGTFAPNEPVKHHFDAFSDVEYAGAAARCVVTGIR